MVFVLDKRKRPLMPCSEKRARLLLRRGRAVVHRLHPFTIRLKDRWREESVLQPVGLKLDPGSKVTGVAIVRREETTDGPVDHVVHLAEITHRSEVIHTRLQQRAAYRRRRRSAHLRYRSRRFSNRRRAPGWLPPAVRSRVEHVRSWTNRYWRWAPITWIDVETVRFDTQQLQHPEIADVEYQRGDLFGYEVKEYVLEKWGHRCAYCGASSVPLKIDHIILKSRGGSNRISNLTLACHACNQQKGNRTAEEYGHPEVQAHANVPLKDAAAVNATRHAILEAVRAIVPVWSWTGGRTKWNRVRLGLPKTHALDALGVGAIAGVSGWRVPVLGITACGRGLRQRTLVDAFGFPRGYRMRTKTVHGILTGDLVRADVPKGRHRGIHRGRVAVRASRSFRVGKTDGISWRSSQLLQRADGYDYEQKGRAASPPHD
jgi:5-methylcytosine-specific restriction endonuclease McrA